MERRWLSKWKSLFISIVEVRSQCGETKVKEESGLRLNLRQSVESVNREQF